MGEGLERVIEAKQEYHRMCMKVAELEAMATKITPVLSDMPKGGGANLKDDTWAKLIDYKCQCEWQLRIYLSNCVELENELDCIRDPKIRTAMKYKYIDDKTIDGIAELMNYDPRTIDRYLFRGRKIYGKYYE